MNINDNEGLILPVLNSKLKTNASGLVVADNSETIIDFSVNLNPNTVGTTFSPNTPTNPDVFYRSTIDDGIWSYDGSSYVSAILPSASISSIPLFSDFGVQTISVDTHNWNPPLLSSKQGYQINMTAGRDLTGITAPFPVIQRDLWLYNTGSGNFKWTLKHDNVNSVAANRIYTPDNGANFELTSRAFTQLVYIPLLSRWILANEIKS